MWATDHHGRIYSVRTPDRSFCPLKKDSPSPKKGAAALDLPLDSLRRTPTKAPCPANCTPICCSAPTRSRVVCPRLPCRETQDALAGHARLLFRMASEPPRARDAGELRAAIAAMGALRRHMSNELGAAATRAGPAPFGLAGLAWLGAPPKGAQAMHAGWRRGFKSAMCCWARSRACTPRPTTRPRRSRASPRWAARPCTDWSAPPSRPALETAHAAPTHSCARAGARGARAAGEHNAHRPRARGGDGARERGGRHADRGRDGCGARGAQPRGRVFVRRLYRALGGLGALMLMGCASAAEARFGTRAKWRQTETGAAVVALLRRVALVLEAYNARKRRGTESGACAPQTPGCVATLQDLAASAFVEASGAGRAAAGL